MKNNNKRALFVWSKRTCMLAIIFLLLFCNIAFAAPNLINYQGMLTDGVGAPITNATQAMTFRLYDNVTAGNLLWEETHNVTVQNGSYNVLLGSATPFTASLFNNGSLWLEIVAAGETLTPRQQLASAPFALRAGCNPGDAVICYTGDATTRNVGECLTGIRICPPDGLRYDSCLGEILPVAELCDGLDNDCDTLINEDFDFANDPNNCGLCGSVCVGDETCTSGICALQCPSNLVGCGSNCVDTATDPNNCGLCGSVCVGDETCISGICSLQCPSNLVSCGSNCVDTATDLNNCGACGTVCVGDETCTSGICSLQCPSNLVSCGSSCVDTATDLNNCGVCGNTCAGNETCIAGACTTQ